MVKMISAREMFNMNMEELCNTAHKNDWDMQTLQAWSTFKIAQYLEMFYERRNE